MSRRKYSWKLLFILVGFCLATVISISWWNSNLKPVSSTDNSPNFFVITNGEPLNQILARLKDSGYIRSVLAAKLYLKVNRLETKIQAGEFLLTSNLSLPQLVKALQYGKKQDILTVPEGYRIEQVAFQLCRLGYFCESGYEFLVNSLKQTTGEGYFFPDTYYLDQNTDLVDLASEVEKNFSGKTDGVLDKKVLSNGLNVAQTLILASLIEREALTDEERPIIAGILLNRLVENWLLQIDATVQYIVGCGQNTNQPESCDNSDWWPKELTENDLKVNSSFNTYQTLGLPPAPICNPGLTSISAAANPKQTDYYFYLHDKEGGVHYAKTLAEHNQNVSLYLK